MIDTLQSSSEFEHNNHREIEQKFLPLFPEQLATLRADAYPIEQYYLSHPSEPFSLRLRASQRDETLVHVATLKDRGAVTASGLDRLEIETVISAETYAYYASPALPMLRKLRAAANNHVTVDFFEDGHIQLESENPIAWASFIEQSGVHSIEVTGDRTADNEWRAHLEYRKNNQGKEALTPQQAKPTRRIVETALRQHAKTATPTIIQILGRSGSGKSTVARHLQDQLQSHGLTSTVLSTDDYHRGNAWLRAYNNGQPWEQWDEPIVYDTEALAGDITLLGAGQPVLQRTMDFTTGEPVFGSTITPAPVIIVEGIYAGVAEITGLSTIRHTVPTPLATCVGRRLLRDMHERAGFTDPAENLRYVLEQAEPAYRAQPTWEDPLSQSA